MSVADTTRCLGIPAATVCSRHFRAKSLMRESLAQEIGGARCDAIVAQVLALLNLDQETFARLAQDAEQNCPVSRVLRAEITLDAKLV